MTDKPHYVILSHTWAEEEVSFRDMNEAQYEGIQNKAGYQKIVKCCEQVLLAGFAWVWIDTCCINKESSAELTEAINSMYTWYWEAEICYAFLVDVGTGDESAAPSEGFVRSNWFNRGWTLQELLAPSVVEFYNHDWTFIGTKSSLAASIAQATRIETTYLLDREVVSDATVGTRFSWASRRVTTRSEDMAYCLLGLFGVHMPMLYGEGIRSFYRLQLEIINSSSDHTIFAWDPQPSDAFDVMGILAPSPKQFINAAVIGSVNLPRTVPVDRVYVTYNITNRGLRISLPKVDSRGSSRIGLLNCRLASNTSRPYIGIELQDNPREKSTYGTTHVVRAMGSKLVYLSRGEASYNHPYSLHIQAESRLLRPTPKVSTSMKIDFVRVDFPSLELRDVIVVAEEDDSCRWLVDGEKIADKTFVIAGNAMCSTISVDSDTFTIIVGYKGDRITLGVLPRPPGHSLSEHNRAVKLLGDTRKFNLSRDYAACSLTPKIQIVAFARKIGTKYGVMWTAVVQIIDHTSTDRR